MGIIWSSCGSAATQRKPKVKLQIQWSLRCSLGNGWLVNEILEALFTVSKRVMEETH